MQPEVTTAEPTAGVLALPLGRFRQPIQDPDLPPVESPEASPDPTTPAESRPASPPPSHPASEPPGLPPPIPAPAGRTRTSSDGDPVQAGKVVAGLIAIAIGSAAALLLRTGRRLRQPSKEQLRGVAFPIGRILARYLPAEFVTETLVDVTEAAAAAHDYVLDGPLVERIPEQHYDEGNIP